MAVPNFMTLSRMLTLRTSPEEYTQLEKNLKRSDNVLEKIQVIYKLVMEKGVAPKYEIYAKKSSEISKEKRQLGNKAFMNKQESEALKLFTDSIAYAQTDSEELALAYANRSAVFCRLKNFTSALIDVNRALKNNYPETLMPKLLSRKNMCISQINSSDTEKELIELATKASSMTLNDQFTDCSDVNFDWKFRSPKVDSEGAKFSNASRKLKLTSTDSWGRHIVAVEDIAAGELLVVEKPYAAIIFPDFYRTHCHQCFIECQSMIPCRNCNLVMFCGEECYKTATELYHKVECEILPSILSLGKLPSVEHLAVRILMMASKQGKNVDYLLNHPIFKDVFSIANRKLNWNEMNCETSDYICVHSLEDNLEKLKIPEMIERMMMALLLLHILKNSDSFSQGLTNSKEITTVAQLSSTDCYIAALLLKYLLVGKMNGHYLCSSFSSKIGVKIAAGLYPLSSCFNHSCDANVQKNFYKDEVAAYSIQPILAGEQIYMDYGATYLETEKEERQSFLREHFYFVCECDPCKFNWPSADDLKKYNDPVPLSDEADLVKLRKMSLRLHKFINSMFKNGFSLALVKENLDFLKEYMMFMRCNIQKPWCDFANCQALLVCALFDRSETKLQAY